jgi:hypothetical protein
VYWAPAMVLAFGIRLPVAPKQAGDLIGETEEPLF